jgi:hypothetical protein
MIFELHVVSRQSSFKENVLERERKTENLWIEEEVVYGMATVLKSSEAERNHFENPS